MNNFRANKMHIHEDLNKYKFHFKYQGGLVGKIFEYFLCQNEKLHFLESRSKNLVGQCSHQNRGETL